MNDEQPTPEKPADAPTAEARPAEPQAQAEEVRGPDPRRRLRELLAIPERERSDAIWDEIIALEIEFAPGNRMPIGQADSGRRPDHQGQRQDPRRQDQGRRQGQPQGKQGKRQGQRHGRGPKPQGQQMRKPV